MIKTLAQIIVNGFAVLIAAYLLKGVHVSDYMIGFIAGAVIILLNILVKPVLIVLTIPITVVTLGLFLLVINAFIIMLTDYLIDGFEVSGFWNALVFSVLLSLINLVFGTINQTIENRR